MSSISRRSCLLAVTGASALGVSGARAGAPPKDADPSDRVRVRRADSDHTDRADIRIGGDLARGDVDGARNARPVRATPAARRTDSDSGDRAPSPTARRTGVTDLDPIDRAGYGRGPRR